MPNHYSEHFLFRWIAQDSNLAYFFLRLSRLYEINLLALLLRKNDNNCEIEGSCGANLFYTPVLSLLKYHLNFTFLKMSDSVNNRCIICYIKRGYHQKARFFWRKSCTVSWCVQVVACRCSLKTCILHWLFHQTYKIMKTFEGKLHISYCATILKKCC